MLEAVSCSALFGTELCVQGTNGWRPEILRRSTCPLLFIQQAFRHRVATIHRNAHTRDKVRSSRSEVDRCANQIIGSTPSTRWGLTTDLLTPGRAEMPPPASVAPPGQNGIDLDI